MEANKTSDIQAPGKGNHSGVNEPKKGEGASSAQPNKNPEKREEKQGSPAQQPSKT